jgi:hypothetical protein
MCSSSQDGDARSLALLATDIIEKVKINDTSHAHQQQEEAISFIVAISLCSNQDITFNQQ